MLRAMHWKHFRYYLPESCTNRWWVCTTRDDFGQNNRWSTTKETIEREREKNEGNNNKS